MSQNIKIRKGVDIRLVGTPGDTISAAKRSKTYAIQPPNFEGLTPKLIVKEGDTVKAGASLFFEKKNPSIRYASPVSGKVAAILRGEKRRIMSVIVEADATDSYIDYGSLDISKSSREEVLNKILEGGMFPFFGQRPFGVVASPEDFPRSIHVSGFDSSPLAAHNSVALDGRMKDFQNGINALAKLAGEGGVHLGVKAGDSTYDKIEGCTKTTFSGPHPAGNVGVQIHHTLPVNKGEVVWTIGYQDVANLGAFLSSGKYVPSRTVSVAGSECSAPAHLNTLVGAEIASLVEVPSEASNGDAVRIISGSPLTGDKVEAEGHLGSYHTAVALLPEGNEPRFIISKGWLSLGLDRFSISKSYLSWMMPKSKSWTLDTNMGGEERAFVVTGEYEKVFPFDIYPVHLLKSILVNDIDSMEKLGIYEVAPEDFALCEYGCTSKIPVQQIVREGLDTLRTELG
ncbi:MAG: NADH:ubiquinone reductase (Na(+)-transporting) subunit A [Crocinitomicaceae bacterium]|nr:NADH:ubiquinone reductase (Na(+)-transporting) subunit A [Crocinitomicaceae bacterium]